MDHTVLSLMVRFFVHEVKVRFFVLAMSLNLAQ